MMNWTTKKLGDIAEFSQGLQVGTGNQFEVQEKDCVKFVRIVDYTNKDEKPRFIKNPINKNKYYVSSNDLVMIRYGSQTAGKITRGIEGVIANNMFKIIPNDQINKNYLFWYLRQGQVYESLHGNQSSSTMPAITFSQIGKLQISFPTRPTQTRIASVLSSYDDLIENNEKRIKALEEMAQLLYTEWFVRFQFPGHEGVGMVESGTEYGEVPEGWEVKRLGDDIELAYGKALKEENRIPGNVLVCGSGGIVGTHNEELVPGPGIVIGRKGNAGSVYWVNEKFYPIDTAFFVKTELNLSFVFYVLKSQKFVLGDAAVPGLNREQAYRNKILIPTSNLIKEFVQKIEPVRKMIGIIEKRNKNLSKTRDLLIPQLVTGRRESFFNFKK